MTFRRSAATRTGHLVLAAAAVVMLPAPAWAAETRLWTESPARLQSGDADGVAVTSDGKLFLAPRLRSLSDGSATAREAHVWSVAADANGNTYLGTGPDGRILKITPSGTVSTLFRVDEPMVTALTVISGGALLAGTAPEGRIYRVTSGGDGEVWSETGERYVWSIATGRDGAVYAGTGEQGIIFKIAQSGEATPLFDSDEPHIVSLLVRDDGSLVAGGAGRGLVYELDKEGHAFVLHDDDLPEVRALALRRDGSLVAALLGPPETEPRPPAVRIQLPDGALIPPGSESMGDLEESTGPTVEGVIEGLRLPEEPPARVVRGRVVRIDPDGGVVELWRSKDEAPYSLVLDADDRAMFGTGEPGRLYLADGRRQVALLASVGEGQISGLLRSGASWVVATSNPAAAYRLDGSGNESGEYVSKPLDASGLARWGTIRWERDATDGRAEFYTRTGNSIDPDATWSAWGPAMIDPAGSPIVNPDGRFLQWRVRLQGGAGADSGVSKVTVSYVPYNRPPSIEDFRLHPGAGAISGAGVFRFGVRDPDGDALETRIEYAPPGSSDWTVAAKDNSGRSASDADGVWSAGEITWDTSGVKEGPYTLRALCSDHASNTPGEGRETTAAAAIALVVDRTPPVIAVGVSGRVVRVEVTDGPSSVSRLEVLRDGEVLFLARPDDGVCDSSRERFTLDLEGHDLSSGTWELRALDAAGNSSTSAVPGA